MEFIKGTNLLFFQEMFDNTTKNNLGPSLKAQEILLLFSFLAILARSTLRSTYY